MCLIKEQTKTEEEWKDDIDLRVPKMKAEEGTHVCPVCQTMHRTKHKCVNPDSRVSLKEADRKCRVLMYLVLLLLHQCASIVRVTETQYGFESADQEGHIIIKENVSKWHDEFQHVVSNHPYQFQVLACDPVFVNPNVADAIKEVFQRVGRAAKVKHYNPDNPNACEWLNVKMDCSPYLVSKTVDVYVVMCTECQAKVPKQKASEHCEKCHGGQNAKLSRNFIGWFFALVSYMLK